jgi:hypothetical protein
METVKTAGGVHPIPMIPVVVLGAAGRSEAGDILG